jgi:hypothetical protein
MYEKDEARDEGLSTAALAEAGERKSESRIIDAKVAAVPAAGEQATSLLSAEEAKDLRTRWDSIQAGFVDEPRQAVQQADNLVAEAMKRLAEMFADERAKLEGQWDRGDNVSTEDLRLALRRYRSFFNRLLSV